MRSIGWSKSSFLGTLNQLALSQRVRSLTVWEFVLLLPGVQGSFGYVSKIGLSAGLCSVSVAIFRLEVLEVSGVSVSKVSHSELLGICVQWRESLEPFVDLRLQAVWASLSRL